MGQIVTFYSYKGGVGRSMALANTAALLSRWGYKTLMVDWDLEAPGLESFFKNYADLEGAAEKRGVVDLLSSPPPSNGDNSEKENWRNLIVSFRLDKSRQRLHLITAGRRDDDYFRKLRDFDVKEFYLKNEGGYVIEALRNEWKQTYDIVLVDSRTGVTDIGGICTIQLPDILVLFFTPTDQGLAGTIAIAKKAILARQDLPVDRLKLLTVPVASRLDVDKEFELSKEWLRRSSVAMSELYADWLPANIKRLDMLELTKIPYKAYFSFGEKLAVMEESVVDPSGLTYAYTNLSAMIANNLQRIEQLRETRDVFVALASRTRERAAPESEILSEVTRELLEEHKKWLDSYGAEGRRADFGKWNLSGATLATADLERALMIEANLGAANLAEADLSWADLTEANLQGADLSESRLSKAIFQGANLIDANLRDSKLNESDLSRANLEGCNLQGANITRANLFQANLSRANLLATDFRGSDLKQTDFTDAAGLLPSALSGTDLAFAKLPTGFAEFEDLKVLNKFTTTLNVALLELPLMAVYAYWAILRTSDVNLVRGSGPLLLPITGTTISTAKFYVIGPLVLFAVYVYLHLFSQRLWTAIGSLPAVFPDGQHLDKILRSWYLKSLVGAHPIREETTLPKRFKGWLAVFFSWWTVPIVLSFFWLRFLPRHDPYGTAFHVTLVMLAILFGWWSFRRTLRTLRGFDSLSSADGQSRHRRTFLRSAWSLLRAYGPLFIRVTLVISLAFLLASLSYVIIHSRGGARLKVLGFTTYVDLSNENMDGANLNGRNLKNAICIGVHLTGAQMVSTDLSSAVLQNADLQRANLTGADLYDAHLERVNLRGAVLAGADLYGTNFIQADLREVLGLTREQLKLAGNISGAQLPDYLVQPIIKVEIDPETKKQITELIKKFDSPDRTEASDLLVELYKEPKNRPEITKALIDGIITVVPASYRVDLYIARTLGSVAPNWEGTSEQLNKVKALQSTVDYKDAIFKYWLDKAIANYKEASASTTDDGSAGRRGGTP